MRILLASENDAVELTPGEHVIGRDVGCQLRFNDPAVSRRHVLIRVGPEGVTVEDLGSRNGTYLNGRLVVARQAVGNGDEIQVGRRLFRVHALGDGERSTDEDTLPEAVGGAAARGTGGLFQSPPEERSPPAPSLPAFTCPGCRGSVPVDAEHCPQCGRARKRRTLGVTMTLPPSARQELADAAEALSAENRAAEDRRRSRRYPIELPVIYISQALMFEAVGTDLSANGIFVSTELFDDLGTPCSVTLLPDGTSALHLTGRVARVVEPTGDVAITGIGIEFDPLEESAHAALARLIGRARSQD